MRGGGTERFLDEIGITCRHEQDDHFGKRSGKKLRRI